MTQRFQTRWARINRRTLFTGATCFPLTAAALTACERQEARAPSTPATPATVEWLVQTGEVWTRIAEQFTSQNAPIKAVATQFPTYDVVIEKTLTLAAAGTPSDLAATSPRDVRPLVETTIYHPIDDLARKEPGVLAAHYPSALDAFRVRGKLYGLWHYANPQATFYNKDLLAASGVREPAADWTYDQWLELSRRVTRRTGDPATAVWGTDAPVSFNYVFNAIRSYGGALFDNDEDPKRFTGAHPKVLAGLQFLADLLLTHRVAPTAEDGRGQGNLFQAGRQGFWTPIVVVIGNTRRQMKQDWDVVPVPRGPAGRFCFLGANGTAFTVPPGRDPRPAWAFLKFLAGVPGQREFLAEYGAVPTVKALAETEYLQQPPPPAHLKFVPEAMAYAKPLPKLPSLDLQKTIEPAFQAIFAGARAAQTAMAEIEGPVNQLLRR